MLEFIENITKSDLFVAVCAYLTVNCGTILGLIVFAVKQRLARSNDQEKYEEECKAYVEEVRKEVRSVLGEVSDLLKQLHKDVFDKIDYMNSEEKKALEEKALNLTAKIAETKQQISIEEILNFNSEDKQ